MNKLNLTLRESTPPCHLIIDFDKLVKEMSTDQIISLPDNGILRAAAKNGFGF